MFEEIQNCCFEGRVREGAGAVMGKEAAVRAEARLPMGHNFSVLAARERQCLNTSFALHKISFYVTARWKENKTTSRRLKSDFSVHEFPRHVQHV